MKDGLSNRFVYEFEEDSLGFLWISTRNGLNRFDGHSFKHFHPDQDVLEVASFQKHLFYTIKTSSYDLDKLHLKNIVTLDTLGNQKILSKLQPYLNRGVNFLKVSDDKKKLFIAYNYEEIIILNTNYEIKKIPKYPKSLDPKLIINPIRDIHFLEQETIWIEYFNSMSYKYDRNLNVIDSLPIKEKIIKVNPDESLLIYKKYNKVYNWNKGEKKEVEIEFNMTGTNAPNFLPSYIYLKSKDQIILNNFGQYFFIDLKNKSSTKISSFNKVKNITPSRWYEDNRGNLWLSTSDGFLKMDIKPKKFKTLLSNTSDEGSDISTRGMALDDENNLYVNSYKGFFKINLEQPSQIKKIKRNYYDGNEVLGFGTTTDSENNILTCTYNNGIEKFNPKTNDLQPYSADNDFTWTSSIDLIEDYKGEIWVGSRPGLYRLDKHKKKVVPFNDERIDNLDIYNLFEDSRQQLWVCTNQGLFSLDANHQQLTSHEKGNVFHDIKDIFEADDGIFWMASKNGLIRWNTKLDTHRLFNKVDGLSNQNLYTAYNDDYGQLWLASDYGLMRFDTTNYSITTYLPNDGIAHEEFNTLSHLRGKDGTFYFGGLNGVTYFHPKNFVEDESQKDSPIRIVQFLLFDGSKNQLVDKTADINLNKKITFNASDKFIDLTLSIIDFKRYSKNTFAYKVEGLDDDWSYLTSNNLRINSLPYGKYTLKIKGQDNTGKWITNEIVLPITVLKPFYLKTWFYITIGLILIGCIYFWSKFRIKNLKKAEENLKLEVQKRTAQIEKDKLIIEEQAETLKEVDRLKTRFFANLSHELRTPLTLILGPVQSLLKGKENQIDKNSKETLTVVERNARRLQFLIEEVLTLSKLEAGSLELNEVSCDINLLLNNIISLFSNAAHSQQISIILDSQIDKDTYLMIDQNKLEKILINLLSNALKFTYTNGKIQLIAKKIENKLSLVVEDSGKGISEKDLPFIFDMYFQSKNNNAPLRGGSGIGLAFSKELTILMKGTIKAESILGEGSTFYLNFPYKKAITEKEILDIENNELQEDHIPFVKNTSNTLKTRTIMVIEDDLDMSHYIIKTLEEYAHVIHATNGQDALNKLDLLKTPIDLFVSDLMMPVMDGFELLKQIKLRPKHQQIPFIILTARASHENKLDALRFGVDDYLTKPFYQEELLIRAQNLISNAKQRIAFTVLVEDEEKEALSKSTPVQISENEQKWLESLESITFEGIQKRNFNLLTLASELAISERQLNRKVKKLVGLSPAQYVKEIKLNYARKLLENRSYQTISEVSYSIGFEDPHYFSSIYKKRFGKHPKDYM